jgi:hypothetical protein
LLPLRLAVENLRVFPDRRVARVTTPEGFLWLPIIIADVWQDFVSLPHAVSEIVDRGGDWYLMLAVKSEDVPTQDGPHFGLDSAWPTWLRCLALAWCVSLMGSHCAMSVVATSAIGKPCRRNARPAW